MKNRLNVLFVFLFTYGGSAWAIDLGGSCTFSDPGFRAYQFSCLQSWAQGSCICPELQHCNLSGYPEDCDAYDPNANGNLPDSCDGTTGTDGDCSPVVIHLDQGTFRFTSVENGVAFDIDDDGVDEATAWTDAASGTGLLVLDYSGNGLVDSGFELFGSVSPQFVGPNGETDGYGAMAMLDSVHGNDDGWLTPEDALWSQLRVWIDGNHDGVSQADELHALTALGLTGIDLDPVISNRSDPHGNILRWRSKAVLDGKVRPIVGDVLFQIEN